MMKELTRSLDRLRTSLVKYLNNEPLRDVFIQIAVQMSNKIPEVFSRVAVSSLTIVGKSRLEIDVRYLLIALRKCPGLTNARDGTSPALSADSPDVSAPAPAPSAGAGAGAGAGTDAAAAHASADAPCAAADVFDITPGQAALTSMEAWVARHLGTTTRASTPPAPPDP